MFYPDRITGIGPTDKVLDVGPGADPHPRAEVLLEMRFDDPAEYANQFGHERPLATDKKLVYYDGITFPFADKEFDYVICSHVLEHVPDVEGFLREVFRVARRGYFEYPLAYYDLLYNINAHVNFLKMEADGLRYMKKADSPLHVFKPLQALMLKTLEKGHTKLVDDMPGLFIEGFQWEKPFAAQRVTDLDKVCNHAFQVPERRDPGVDSHGAKALLKGLGSIVKRRIGGGT